jgi:hypothetical protein
MYKFQLSVISAAHCVYQSNKEDILILANSLSNEIGKNKRFGETTHHVDEIRLHENYVRGKTRFDICLLRVKELFTGTVNFAKLPQMLVIVKGNHLIHPIYKIEPVETNYFSDGKECLMLGWGTQRCQSFSKTLKFLHVVKTYIRADNLQATIGLENSRIISTTPDVALGVRKYCKVMSSRLLIIFAVLRASKGQMKSECIYEIIDFPKYH